MKRYLHLILALFVLVLLASCQTMTPMEEAIKEPTPNPMSNRLSEADFTTAKGLYENNCQFCHSSGNQGIAPDFNNHLPTFAKVANGKTHLINALLYGMQGEIVVNGQTFNGIMNNRSNSFDDSQIALLLNYGLTAWDNSSLLPEDFTLITAADVAKERQTPKTADEVYTARQALQLP